MKEIRRYIILLFVSVLLNGCAERTWENPYDPACETDNWYPTNFSADQNSYNEYVTLDWIGYDHIDGYLIKRSQDGGEFVKIGNPSSSETQYIDNNVESGIKYTYSLQAIAGKNTSNTLTTEITPIFLASATISFENLTSDSVTCVVNIDNKGGTINYYEIQWSKENDFSQTEGEFSKWGDPGNFFKVKVDLEESTTYYFRAGVQSTSKSRQMSYSDTYTITTPKRTHIVWSENQTITSSNGEFYSLVEIENLTIGDNVEITNSGTSQLILKVSNKLTLGKNAVIKVRNGYYPEAPSNPIENINISSLNGLKLFPNTFGKGGDGSDAYYCGGGGGGGFGGGNPGSGVSYGIDGGYSGLANGGRGGNCGYASRMGSSTYAPYYGDGGECCNVGGNASLACGGGGNGGKGASYYNSSTGGGGGGGGYGGGVLLIIANEIVFDANYPPLFVVSGQIGGEHGCVYGKKGGNGQGGLLIIECPNYTYNADHWNLNANTIGTHNHYSYNGGHGIVTGNPTKVFINGIQK